MSSSVLFDKPLFSIKVNAFGVRFFLKINGISVMRQFDSFGQIETMIPINHWMHPKNNLLGMKVYPDEQGAEFNSKSYVKMELWMKECDAASQDQMITSICFNAGSSDLDELASESAPSEQLDSKGIFVKDDKGDVMIGKINIRAASGFEGALILDRNVVMDSSLTQWKFFSSDELPNYDDMEDDQYFAALDDLFVEYKKIQDALSARDFDAIISMMRERNNETDLAFYLQPGTTEKRLRASIEAALQDKDMELADLSPDYLSIRVEDNKRLVRLVRGGDSAAVGFNFKSLKGSESYDFIFRRENGKWIVTR